MLKNIANFLFNQSGGFTVENPTKALKTSSIDELHSYIQSVSLSLAKQVVDSRKDVSSCRDELTQALAVLYGDLRESNNQALINDLRDRNIASRSQFSDFALIYISDEVNRLRSSKTSSSKRSGYGIIAASPFGIVLAPLEKHVNSSVRNAQNNASLEPIVVKQRVQDYSGIPRRK